MPDSLSVSRIALYLHCPRKYRFRYVEHQPPERRSAHLALGAAVHSAIAWWQEERMAGRQPTEGAVLRTFRADWTAERASGLLDADAPALDALRSKGEALVRLFLERFAGELPEAVEARFEVPLRDPATGEALPVPLVGAVDQVRAGVVDEIKTTARKGSASAWSLQLAAYSYAWREATGVRPTLRVIQLVKGKVPQVLVEDLVVTAAQEAWFCEVASEVFRAISADVFFPNPSWMCGRCEYRRACRV